MQGNKMVAQEHATDPICHVDSIRPFLQELQL